MKSDPPSSKFQPPLDILPPTLVAHFRRVYRIRELLPWQSECLSALRETIEGSSENIVIRAPTGAGKSLVSDLLSIYYLAVKRVGTKVVYVVPYVSLLSEKHEKLEILFSPLTLSVLSLLGNKPYNLFDKADIILCTIEKASQLIYGLIETCELSKISMVVIDEVQFVGDEQRGSLLETLIAKILYCQQFMNNEIQILAISATIDNFFDFVKWMRAKHYECTEFYTDIKEFIKIENKLISPSGQVLETIKEQSNDKYKICALVDLVLSRGPILAFSPSKAICEELATILSTHRTINVITSEFIKTGIEKAELVEERMTNKVGWLMKGIACHHAGLLAGERLFIEDLYRSLAINTLICTSTLAAGVNLPANIVIIVGLKQGTSQVSVSMYKQMRGRAGRVTFKGECYILCKQAEQKQVLNLINSTNLQNPVLSTLDKHGMSRLLLEGISLKYVNGNDGIKKYVEFTLLTSAVDFLVGNELVEEKTLAATKLGEIVARSGGHIEEMLIAYWELQAANAKYLPWICIIRITEGIIEFEIVTIHHFG
eukprot:TRINITY_DN3378_c0_g1_i8.p1 TRINITY_DN3378_c0_g1~~TRINITY_DN3378_c0_g1_i8.p1  ORF type:complete len:543 (+),score=52.14 TRINITY_DN3378_c0_g1_i8:61-1689(+)